MSPEAIRAALAHLADEWSEDGYRVEQVRPAGRAGAAVIDVAHFDGSRFAIAAGRYGWPIAHADTAEEAVRKMAELATGRP